MWSLIPTFFASKHPNIIRITTLQTLICWKCKTFSHEFQSRKTFWGAPSWRRDFWPCLPLWGPGPSFPLASTAAPFESRNSAAADVAVERCQVQRRLASGAFPGPSAAVASGGRQRRDRGAAETTKVVGMLSSIPVQPTKDDECFGPNIFETVQSRKLSQTHRTSFKAFKIQHDLQQNVLQNN